MLNFLTQNIKNKVINEYSLRLVVVLLIMIFIVCVFLISLFLPSFFMSMYKSLAIDDQYRTTMLNIKEDSLNSIEIVKENNSLISVLSSKNAQDISTSTSEFIEKIFLLKNENIKISSVLVSNKVGEVKVIIGGVSKTREGLTLFNKALKNSYYFDEIILPVVNLLKSIDIEFNITLIYKQK
jgi:hypothetical protein